MPKTVYIGMTVDTFHHGHIDVIETGRQYGDVVIGLVADQAVSKIRRPPCLEYEQRKRILEGIEGVKQIVPQDDWDCVPNLRRYRPDYMIDGYDWIDGPEHNHRARAREVIREWGGQIIEMPDIAGKQRGGLARPTAPLPRQLQLRRQLAMSGFVRAIEVHSPLCGLIAERAVAERDGAPVRFDAMWSSSLVDSTVRGKPDIEVLDHSARLSALDELFDVTAKPLLYDADTGGRAEHFSYTVRTLERIGVSAVVIEDKIGLKRNSLLGGDARQMQESIENFCRKIAAGKAAQVATDFAIVGRIESLILDAGLDDAITRAREYVAAGADGVMIHSRSRDPAEVFAFCDRFRAVDAATILVAVPTTYNSVCERDLQARGVNIVIYANHLLRAAYPAMMQAAQAILKNGRCQEADSLCMSVDEILRLVPGTV